MKLVFIESNKPVPMGPNTSVPILTGVRKGKLITIIEADEPSEDYPNGRVKFNISDTWPQTWEQLDPICIGAYFAQEKD